MRWSGWGPRYPKKACSRATPLLTPGRYHYRPPAPLPTSESQLPVQPRAECLRQSRAHAWSGQRVTLEVPQEPVLTRAPSTPRQNPDDIFHVTTPQWSGGGSPSPRGDAPAT